ncbi:hypothetical protein [Pseudomonas sp. PSKL.D1]|uniref:hypothetical protein n=1 Tax=Pseudomonas sp. PSKL.D1 TaxID=3029060 RepID=UPI002381201C|nr:hypothetical protein [Pseudomonas sp. PSKL.D1]WDY59637.1 hypothetical protein PVV54_08435 [Pseudomonas sp. PSKL.D1]
MTTIKNSDQALEIFKDGGEVAIDAALEDKLGIEGVLKDIPILNVAISLYKAGNQISAYFFAKKMITFLAEINKVPSHTRIDFLNQNCSDESGVENVGEVALMILDKIDHPKLAAMLGRAFALLTIGAIGKQEFDIYAHIIKNLNPYLQRQMAQCYKIKGMMAVDAPTAQLLANYGLLKVEYKLNSSSNSLALSSINTSHLGEKFYTEILVGRTTY